eukprot:1881118-Prymnesium_polylepis.2
MKTCFREAFVDEWTGDREFRLGESRIACIIINDQSPPRSSGVRRRKFHAGVGLCFHLDLSAYTTVHVEVRLTRLDLKSRGVLN